MSPEHRQFAAFITEHRTPRGLSMARLADQLGVTKSNVHYWESGEGLPKAQILEPLAQALGVSYEDLFALAGYSRPEGLPAPAPYLRAKFPDLSDEAIAEAERFFKRFERRHGTEGGGDADESDR